MHNYQRVNTSLNLISVIPRTLTKDKALHHWKNTHLAFTYNCRWFQSHSLLHICVLVLCLAKLMINVAKLISDKEWKRENDLREREKDKQDQH